ncbi:thiamine pyrophosphate-binding protein [Mucilaginibacter terrenus]|uniref:Thiamine pyrophosphate-binding protein n=1 Tax=Mucilaginibacter terrenus TaxID=2482727 RepID=A0A3E2NUW7_9SPHI|nr:thiamine pyrophosphate-binding protein [Mucilaginibacter terrenus]RFZ84813.1 thiamine pyrophosphate-binding protein [Mucilaginibacter terrenus]
MKASDFIATFLEKKGVTHVFELSGGMITHLLDSLNQKTAINIITMHHEQSAAFAADAFGRVTGIPGVALATSGPGATNLLTGIGSCYFDSTPAIFITGQVNRHEQKGERPVRQLGFQETDIIAMAKPVTKACFKIESEHDLPKVLEDAFRIATEGRPGPVLIDVPMDVQRAQIEPSHEVESNSEPVILLHDQMQKMIVDIEKAERPLLLVGRGVRAAFAIREMNAFLEKTEIPVVTTLLAVDAIAHDNLLRFGFIGSYGNRWANIAFGECDLLIVVGSRLDIRQTGADVKFFENRTIYHVDCEAGEINNRVKGCIPLVMDARQFFIDFNNTARDISFKRPDMWFDYVNGLKEQWPDTKELEPKGINPNIFMHKLSHNSRVAKCYVADVGSHQMWAAQSVELYEDQLFLTSAGMGAMGYALPAGIGASFALGIKPVIVIAGDGCMQINIQELQTIVRNKLPVKIVIMNNKNLGMIRQFQDSYFESRYQSTYWGYSAPDFQKVAEAYGISSMTIVEQTEIDDAVRWMWNEANADKPILLQVMIDPHTNTYPKIAFGKPITEMEPFAKPIEMEST